MSFPCVGDIYAEPCVCAPDGWEEYHSYVWPEFWNYEGHLSWAIYSWATLPPDDRLITESNVRALIEYVFNNFFHEGAPVRMCFMNRADRVAGIPVLWHYDLYLEWHSSPGFLAPAAVLEAFLSVALIVIGITIAMKMGGNGVIDKVGDKIVVPAISGIALIFILGIGFVVALSYLAPGVRATARPPKVPGAGLLPVGEVSVGPVPATRRRR